jgi:hypothetical protein
VVATLVNMDGRCDAAMVRRLCAYMASCMDGRDPFRSLDELWQWLIVANALDEVISASHTLREWAYARWDKLVDRYLEGISEGRIRLWHLYEDVEAFVTAEATYLGVGSRFEQALRAHNYVPATLFYVLLGRPERIVLRAVELETARRKLGMLNSLGHEIQL